MKSFLLINFILSAFATAATTTPASMRATTQSAMAPIPTRVSLRLNNVPVGESLSQLFEQAHVPVSDEVRKRFTPERSAEKVTLSMNDVPFYAAFLEICRQSKLEPQLNSNPQAMLTIVPRRMHPSDTPRPCWVDAPTQIAGPFAFLLTDARRFSQVDLQSENSPELTRQMDLEFTVLHDPNLKLFAIAERIAVDKATDEAGHSLLDSGPSPEAALKRAGDRPWNPGHATATLAYPPQTSQRIALLRGHLDIEVITKSDAFPIIKSGTFKPTGWQKTADMEFAIDDMKETKDAVTFAIKLRWLGNHGAQEEWEQVRWLTRKSSFHTNDDTLFIVEPQMNLFNGSLLEFSGILTIRPTAKAGNKKAAPIPIELTWTLPTEVTDFAVPIEFHDLLLP